MKRRALLLPARAAGALLMVACQAQPSSAPSRCLEVPAAKASVLHERLPPGVSVRALQAVKSRDFENVYFVSGEVQGLRFEREDEIATWATNRLEEARSGVPGAGFFTAPGLARQLGGWSSGQSFGFDPEASDDGYEESRDCVRGQLSGRS